MSPPTWTPTSPELLASPSYEEMAEWIVRTCLLFGTTVETAYTVAGLFVAQVKSDRGERAAEVCRRRSRSQRPKETPT
ncbi:MAG: hypothetical protein ACHREM_04730 [Polyangiales bacterium]